MFIRKHLQIAAMNLMIGDVVAIPFGTRGTVLGPGHEGRIEAREVRVAMGLGLWDFMVI